MNTWEKTIVCCRFCGKTLPRSEVKIKGKNVAVCGDCVDKALSLLADHNAKNKITREYEEEQQKRNFNRNWRNDPITEKQRQFITGASKDYKKFYGKTKGEAYDYIQEFLEYDKERRLLEAAEAEVMFEHLNGVQS